MDAVTETTAVRREIEIAARPETVWELLTDEREAVRWMGLDASFDLRPGGTYRVQVLPGHTALGEFVEIDPPHRLVLTWGWEEPGRNAVPPGSSAVEFELVPSGDGTLLRFTHRDLPNGESVASHEHGWRHYLARLAVCGDGGSPGPDAWTQPAAVQTALLYFEAWASRDLDRALEHVADDVVCEAPAGRIEGIDAYRAFMTPFVGILRNATMLAAYGDDEEAVVVYDTATVPVPSAPAAEWVAVADGKIARSRFVFDRAPFEAARRAED